MCPYIGSCDFYFDEMCGHIFWCMGFASCLTSRNWEIMYTMKSYMEGLHVTCPLSSYAITFINADWLFHEILNKHHCDVSKKNWAYWHGRKGSWLSKMVSQSKLVPFWVYMRLYWILHKGAISVEMYLEILWFTICIAVYCLLIVSAETGCKPLNIDLF